MGRDHHRLCSKEEGRRRSESGLSIVSMQMRCGAGESVCAGRRLTRPAVMALWPVPRQGRGQIANTLYSALCHGMLGRMVLLAYSMHTGLSTILLNVTVLLDQLVGLAGLCQTDC